MYAVVRRYENASALGTALLAHQQEVFDLISAVPGFVTYYAIGEDGVLATVTVCQDKAGTDESTRLAAEWVRANLAGGVVAPPEVTEGTVVDMPGLSLGDAGTVQQASKEALNEECLLAVGLRS
jgi:hypothetical protein